jgi:hypothetical protein
VRHAAVRDANQGPSKGPLTCAFTVGDSRFELLTPSVSILPRVRRRVSRGAKRLQNKGSRRRLSLAGGPCHQQLMDIVMDSSRGPRSAGSRT